MKRNRYFAVIATLVLGATSLAFGEVDGWAKQTPTKGSSIEASCCPGCCEATKGAGVTTPKAGKYLKNPFSEPKDWGYISEISGG